MSGLLPKCCQDLEIDPLHLVFPELLDRDGLEFATIRGLYSMNLKELQQGAILKPNGQVRIQHRCQHLLSTGKCGIYDTRPQICRKFDCATRVDCACRGLGWPHAKAVNTDTVQK